MTEITPTDTSGSELPASPAPTGFDLDAYLPLMDDFDMAETQKREFLGILCNIMLHFVNWGFDLRAVDICGQFSDGFNECAGCVPDGVESGPAPDGEKTFKKEDTQ